MNSLGGVSVVPRQVSVLRGLDTFSFIFVMTMNNDLPKGGVGDAGPSYIHPSAEKPKNPRQRGGWVRGHQKDGGGYAKEMPKYITGKDIVLLFKFTPYYIL